jgi:hypothetical protein
MRFRVYLSALIILSTLANAGRAQAPSSATTAFDGKYVGTATLTRDQFNCSAITSMFMTISGGQVVIHEIHDVGWILTYQGSVNAAGEVSASHENKNRERVRFLTVSGTIHDNVFTGPRRDTGRWCDYNVQMRVASAPALMTAFDGEYFGVSRESSKTANAPDAECPPNGVPARLTIWNGLVRSDEASWQGTVTPQGVLAMSNQRSTRVDGQIDGQGIVRGQGAIAPDAPLLRQVNRGSIRRAATPFPAKHTVPKDKFDDRNGCARLARRGLGVPAL